MRAVFSVINARYACARGLQYLLCVCVCVSVPSLLLSNRAYNNDKMDLPACFSPENNREKRERRHLREIDELKINILYFPIHINAVYYLWPV